MFYMGEGFGSLVCVPAVAGTPLMKCLLSEPSLAPVFLFLVQSSWPISCLLPQDSFWGQKVSLLSQNIRMPFHQFVNKFTDCDTIL